MKYQFLLNIVYLLICPFLHAEVITDGTLGSRTDLSGPDFKVSADLGQQRGGNLFHSFQSFNLQQSEYATFSGPAEVQNIISRVTGGHPSTIDGTIRSTIPKAELYFLNPYGIFFGPHAKLDVQGGFHASTADYLRLQDGGQFDAHVPGHSLLSVAPIEAFGFLTDSPAALTIDGSQLSVPDENRFSLVGGKLSIRNGQLLAPRGQFKLISIDSPGEADLLHLSFPSTAKQGVIRLFDQTTINAGGAGGGEISIQGGQLIIEDSALQANTLGEQNGQGIHINLTTSVDLKGNSAQIASSTFGKGEAGPIAVNTPRLTVNQAKLLSNSFGEGAAGDIHIDTLQTAVYEGGRILNESHDKGHGGNLTILAKESLSIIDKRIFPKRDTAQFLSHVSSAAFKEGTGGHVTIHTAQLTVDGGSIVSHSHTRGDAGEIVVDADSVEIRNGGLISATILSQSSGKGGNITFRVKDTLHISGFRVGFSVTTTDVFENMQSAIAAITFGSGPAGNIHLSARELIVENQSSIGAATGGIGNAGKLTINVDDLILKSGGLITNSSGGIVGGKVFLGTGAGGFAQITAKNSLFATGRGYFNPSGILSNTLASGQGGNVEIRTNQLILTEGAEINANSLGTGRAGELTIYANTLRLTGSHINTEAKHAAGGKIYLYISDLLYLLKSGHISTSVASGPGGGGDITIGKPQFMVLNQGQIKAQADEGNGGNIRILTEQFIPSFESLVSASSQKGISGNVVITSPDNNIATALVALHATPLGADRLIGQCRNTGRTVFDDPDRFSIIHLRGGSPEPEDWQ